MLKSEVQFRTKQIVRLASYGMDSGIIKNLLDGVLSVVGQHYYGDVTIHPQIQLKDYGRIFGNLSLAEFQSWVLAGEHATWPKIAMIRDQTIIGQTLEDCIIRLKRQRQKRQPI